MYVVTTAYSDNSAMVTDLMTYETMFLTESEIVRLINSKHSVLGVTISSTKRSIVNMSAYSFIQFISEDEAYEYCRETGISTRNILCISNTYYILERIRHSIPVNYYVCYWRGQVATYLCENGGFTNYIQNAKGFSKEAANKTAAIMKRRSKTGKYWTIQRVELS